MSESRSDITSAPAPKETSAHRRDSARKNKKPADAVCRRIRPSVTARITATLTTIRTIRFRIRKRGRLSSIRISC